MKNARPSPPLHRPRDGIKGRQRLIVTGMREHLAVLAGG